MGKGSGIALLRRVERELNNETQTSRQRRFPMDGTGRPALRPEQANSQQTDFGLSNDRPSLVSHHLETISLR